MKVRASVDTLFFCVCTSCPQPGFTFNFGDLACHQELLTALVDGLQPWKWRLLTVRCLISFRNYRIRLLALSIGIRYGYFFLLNNNISHYIIISLTICIKLIWLLVFSTKMALLLLLFCLCVVLYIYRPDFFYSREHRNHLPGSHIFSNSHRPKPLLPDFEHLDSWLPRGNSRRRSHHHLPFRKDH